MSSDVYDSVRRGDHSTLGDAAKRFDRDADAFTAGAQYALDRLLSRTTDILDQFGESLTRCVVGSAAEILSNIHEGRL